MDRARALATVPTRASPAVGPLPVQQMFRQHAPFVAMLAYRLLGRNDEVDDVVQDVFLVAVRGANALREPAAARHWLATITVRFATRRLRVLRLRRFCGLDEAPEYEELAAPGTSPEDRAMLTHVYEVLDGAPAPHRIAWCLRHVEGYELTQVAELCHCSLATAKRRIAAAQSALRKAVDDV